MARRRAHVLQDQRERFLACRGPIRHRWELIVSSPDQRPSYGALALFRCDNCETLRHDIFSRTTGELLSRRYEHPDGYKETGTDMNGVPLTSAEMRLEWSALVNQRDAAAIIEGDNVTPIERAMGRG